MKSEREGWAVPAVSVYVAALVALICDLALPLGVAGGVPLVLPVLLALVTRAPVVPTAVLCSSLTLLGWALSPAGEGPQWIVALNRLYAVGAIAAVAWFGTRLRRYPGELRGLLPICGACTRVRTKDQRWQQIEAYVRANSDADFTHTLCESCATTLLAEFD